MTPTPIDVDALRRLLDIASIQETKRGSMVPMSHDTKALFDALTPVLPALLRAVEERDQLLSDMELLAGVQPDGMDHSFDVSLIERCAALARHSLARCRAKEPQ